MSFASLMGPSVSISRTVPVLIDPSRIFPVTVLFAQSSGAAVASSFMASMVSCWSGFCVSVSAFVAVAVAFPVSHSIE